MPLSFSIKIEFFFSSSGDFYVSTIHELYSGSTTRGWTKGKCLTQETIKIFFSSTSSLSYSFDWFDWWFQLIRKIKDEAVSKKQKRKMIF